MQTALPQFRPSSACHGMAAMTQGALLGLLILLSSLLAWPGAAQAERIKDLASVQGVRTNKLTGVGLVVGLDGTGDQTTQVPQTTQGLMSMLQQFGIVVPPGTTVQTRNIAIVAVTAELPPFAKPGQEIDVTVLSQGNSKSLRGGSLLATPLKGLDGQVYAIAQGNLIVGGAGASAGGSKVQINSLNAGRIPGGASVERAVPTPLLLGDSIQLALNSDDYSTARLVARAINETKGSGTAQALDGRTVRVAAPTNPDDRINFLADLENLKVDLMAPSAKVVINARTGSIVMNQAVTLNACAIAHGNLAVTITSTPQVSQPGPLSNGQTTVTTKTDISIKQEPGVLIQLPASAKLADVVKALNSLGATPGDLVTILQAMKSAGALSAELEVI